MRTLPGTVLPGHTRIRFMVVICGGILLALILVLSCDLTAQDGSTSLQGIIEDSSGARVVAASITVTDASRGLHMHTVTDGQGGFNFAMLPPGRYDVVASAPGMATRTSRGVELLVGGVSVVQLRLTPAAPAQTITVTAQPTAVETQTVDVSNMVTQRAVQDLPLNGRRFTDLALLSSDVVPDPRGLTSDSNGDLSVGGVRGFQNSFLVDGTDDNNSFFAQARGRYRAPYQFSNEVIKEFRVSPNIYSAETGRAGAPCSMSPQNLARMPGMAAASTTFAIASLMPASLTRPINRTIVNSSLAVPSEAPSAKIAYFSTQVTTRIC